MLEQKEKENYIKLIDSLEYDKEYSDILKDFVNTYDGSNIKQLRTVMLGLIILMMSYQEIKIKADGFDALEYDNEEYKKKVSDIKRDFDNLNKGELPQSPFSG